MSVLGFSAEASLYRTDRRYQTGRYLTGSTEAVIIPAIPACGNCADILDRCSRNGWRPRAVCSACAAGDCYEEPPPPDPYPDPFKPLPRF